MEEKYSALGMTTVGNKPDEFTADIANRIETWKAVIDKAGIVLPE
jgi:tripartite-type tricarboxylate transporter receptor subunit TctC